MHHDKEGSLRLAQPNHQDLDTKCRHKNSWQFRQQKPLINIDLANRQVNIGKTRIRINTPDTAHTIKVADVLQRYVISREYKSVLQFASHHDVIIDISDLVDDVNEIRAYSSSHFAVSTRILTELPTHCRVHLFGGWINPHGMPALIDSLLRPLLRYYTIQNGFKKLPSTLPELQPWLVQYKRNRTLNTKTLHAVKLKRKIRHFTRRTKLTDHFKKRTLIVSMPRAIHRRSMPLVINSVIGSENGTLTKKDLGFNNTYQVDFPKQSFNIDALLAELAEDYLYSHKAEFHHPVDITSSLLVTCNKWSSDVCSLLAPSAVKKIRHAFSVDKKTKQKPIEHITHAKNLHLKLSSASLMSERVTYSLVTLLAFLLIFFLRSSCDSQKNEKKIQHTIEKIKTKRKRRQKNNETFSSKTQTQRKTQTQTRRYRNPHESKMGLLSAPQKPKTKKSRSTGINKNHEKTKKIREAIRARQRLKDNPPEKLITIKKNIDKLATISDSHEGSRLDNIPTWAQKTLQVLKETYPNTYITGSYSNNPSRAPMRDIDVRIFQTHGPLKSFFDIQFLINGHLPNLITIDKTPRKFHQSNFRNLSITHPTSQIELDVTTVQTKDHRSALILLLDQPLQITVATGAREIHINENNEAAIGPLWVTVENQSTRRAALSRKKKTEEKDKGVCSLDGKAIKAINAVIKMGKSDKKRVLLSRNIIFLLKQAIHINTQSISRQFIPKLNQMIACFDDDFPNNELYKMAYNKTKHYQANYEKLLILKYKKKPSSLYRLIDLLIKIRDNAKGNKQYAHPASASHYLFQKTVSDTASINCGYPTLD